MQVELYGLLREAAGSDRVETPLTQPAPIEQVLQALVETYPGLAPHLPRVACAVGDTMRSRQATIAPDETLVLLPPVSGG
ncbi:MoaD/ThiS family protein [Spiribacter pallidus]|uniref:MoaD/ThiS family protein n=1 Tax=Spiribacter pallidus TaxID=1987936 RepID=A0ABV3TDH3_9GAMM